MSQELDKETVLRIAKLARLELSSDEIKDYQKRLGRVLGYVEELEAVESGGEFVRHIPLDAVSVREDRSLEFDSVSLLLENAPKKSDGAFMLPPVLD